MTRTDVWSGRPLVESRHRGHLALVGRDDELVAALGDPDRVTFVRSTAKPFQATACLELLDLAGPELGADEVAVGWASHRAEPTHLAAVRSLLARSGTTPEDLTCPPTSGEHDPGAPPSRLTSDCSGKHALFALAGQQQGTTRDRLLDPDGPLQRVVLGVVEEFLGPPVAVGVDGCGAPAVAVPLRALAAGFAAVASQARLRRVREAGFAHPKLVGGEGRLESTLLAHGVVAKSGAEGVFAAGWLAPDGSPRGLALKAEDGASRAVTAAALAVLVAAGRVDADLWSPAPILGGGRPTGAVRVSDEVAQLLG
ncbi:MAG: asparaginase [Nitriliruptor sp.]|uniref:asparaginase n=1 Tax=Nitriliruptor sp. TaxID=2448056 RepID=UPI0034A06094